MQKLDTMPLLLSTIFESILRSTKIIARRLYGCNGVKGELEGEGHSDCAWQIQSGTGALCVAKQGQLSPMHSLL